MPKSRFRGIFSIPVTPFLPDGRIDDRSLRRCIEFTVEAGADGVVAPVNASEYYTLSELERRHVIETLVEVVGGRVPVVAGVSGVSTLPAVELAQFAEQAGVDAIMSMPPGARPLSQADIRGYFEALSRAVSIPIFIQNNPRFCNNTMSGALMAELIRDLDHVDYIKEESLPAGHTVTAVIEAAGDWLDGIMGGMGGRYLMDEWRRGACGSMPACQVTDAFAKMWRHLEAGEEREARDVFNRMLPLLNHEDVFGVAAYKAVLRRRGIIDSTTMRIPARRTRDRYDEQELDVILKDMADLLTWQRSAGA